MNDEQIIKDLADAVMKSNAVGTILIEMSTEHAIALIAVIQLAWRHPTARYSPTVKQMEQMARDLQAGLATRDERLGRYLEQGWHGVFDMPTERKG